MLPFLKPRQISSVILAKRKPNGNIESEGQEGKESEPILMIAEKLISAIHEKDASRVAQALREAQDILDIDEEEESEEKE